MSISIIGGADGPTSVFLAGKIGNLFMIPAFMILLFFYGIYFAKQATQKRRGIRTWQLGRGAGRFKGKENSVRIVEKIMSVAVLLIVSVELISVIVDWNFMPIPVRIIGVVAGILGDLLFLTAVLTMKSSWRAGIPEEDKTEFVSQGIYRYSRNPAFLGFDLMYAGILLMYFNWILLAFTVWAMVMLHLQILQEEKYLSVVFGEEYSEYRKQTCRYFGRKKA